MYLQSFITTFSLTRQYIGKNFSTTLYNFIPFGYEFFHSYFLLVLVKFFANPIIVMMFYYVVMEFTLGPLAKKFKVSTLVKFNLMFIFLTELILTFLILSGLTFLTPSPVFGFKPKRIWKVYYLSTLFISFLFMYIFCYFCALRRVYPSVGKNVLFGIPQKILDSIAFWFKLKRKK
jgi:hypothetical protein